MILCVWQIRCTSSSSPQVLSESDVQAIRDTRKAYDAAWLANDSLLVLQTLSSDPVLIPHHGDEPIEGIEAIRDFWWPANSSPATVTVYTSTIDEVEGSGDLAYIRGRFRLVFEYESQQYANEGNYLNVLKKESGNWLLSRLIWNDPIPEID